MMLSEFLARIAAQEGAAALQGAVILAALDRPVDHLIQLALGLGPYHPGKESPWSHSFLIAQSVTLRLAGSSGTSRLKRC